MFKTFIFGVVMGIGAATAALYFLPVVNQQREASIITVAPNGGNSETFQINVPMDRIMLGARTGGEPLPVGMQWPEFESLEGVRAELFKIRNERDTVIGVASRIAVKDTEQDDIVEWVLHFPARGSIYFTLDSEPTENGYRAGQMRAGSNEFAELTGQVTERWVPDESASEDSQNGKIELVSRFVGVHEEIEEEDML